MMGGAPALKVAIDLMQVPSRVRHIRSQPLPDGVVMLLQILAGDPEAESKAAELTGKSLDIVREAAAFFIEQILFCHGADSYRVLGANKDVTSSELRRNMALLLRWLHPDIDRFSERSLFVGRVIRAWDNLKTPERRAAYDAQQRTLTTNQSHDCGQRSARVKSANQEFKARRISGAPYGRIGKSGRRRHLIRVGRTGLLRRALWLLLGGPRQ
jgi:hypothetical protein